MAEGKTYRWQEVANSSSLSRSALQTKKMKRIKIPFKFKYTKFDITLEVNGFELKGSGDQNEKEEWVTTGILYKA